jgi:hypothetical protein
MGLDRLPRSTTELTDTVKRYHRLDLAGSSWGRVCYAQSYSRPGGIDR